MGNPYGQNINPYIIAPVNLNESDHLELLGTTIYKHLSLESHIEGLFRNANYKQHDLRRIIKYLTIEKPNY